jgi:large subunit ribosomal protein L32
VHLSSQQVITTLPHAQSFLDSFNSDRKASYKINNTTMATAHVTTRSILSSFLPRMFTPATATTSRSLINARQIAHPLLPSLAISIPAISINVPGILEGLWESVLRAVPKKKTSHMKKRHRQMAGKALKDVGVNRCSACGHAKRAHVLCPYCVSGMQSLSNWVKRC